jgi:hypothetical protein
MMKGGKNVLLYPFGHQRLNSAAADQRSYQHRAHSEEKVTKYFSFCHCWSPLSIDNSNTRKDPFFSISPLVTPPFFIGQL